jgi:tetratricopeptide (TPR) repeat protein
LQSGDVQAALDDFNQAIQLDPDHARAWALRGQVRLREGRFDEAAADLRKALGSGNALYETMLLAGLALHRAGKKEEARQLLLTVARDRPEHPRGRLAQAVLDLDEKHYAAAISGLSSAADDPFLRPFALGLRSRAWIALGSASGSQAMLDAEAVCSAWPRDGFARFEAALVHAQAAELLAAPPARAAALDRASQLLVEAGELGCFKLPVHASRLQSEQAFSPLKDLPVIQKLLGAGASK